MLFFADRAEGAVTQGVLMGSVTVTITLLLLLLAFFHHPHGGGFEVESRDEAERLDAAAEISAAEVRLNIQRASNYVLTVVLYAVVLFFAGMSTRLRNTRPRWVMTLAGCVVLAAAGAWMATFPVSLAV